MSETKKGLAPSHPGALLREMVLPALNVTVKQAASDMQMSRNLLHGIMAERKPVTAETAIKLGKYCGNGAGLWLRMQGVYDLHRAEIDMAKIVKQIPVATAAS